MNKVKFLIYCTKDKNNQLYRYYGNKYDVLKNKQHTMPQPNFFMNGKIVAQFDCEKVDFYVMEYYKDNLVLNQIGIYDEYESKEWGYDCFKKIISNEYSNEEIANCELIKKSCLSFDELGKYVCAKNGIDNFYAIHISNLEIFDKPKELNDFKFFNPNYYLYTNIKKAPQNMCYVVKERAMFFAPSEEYILISIRPEWVEKILNGSKTIEVRKKILNSLKELI